MNVEETTKVCFQAVVTLSGCSHGSQTQTEAAPMSHHLKNQQNPQLKYYKGIESKDRHQLEYQLLICAKKSA